MSEETNWANIVDENSKFSMDSVDFTELLLVKLENKRSQVCSNLLMDNSKKGLVSRDLHIESNSICSTSSQKRCRYPTTDYSLSNANRLGSDAPDGVRGNNTDKSSPTKRQSMSFGSYKFQSERKQMNFSDTEINKRDEVEAGEVVKF